VPAYTTPPSVRHCDSGTDARAAATATSCARAVAPASRAVSHTSRTLDEPPVIITPISRIVLAVSQRTARTPALPSRSSWNGNPSTMAAMLL